MTAAITSIENYHDANTQAAFDDIKSRICMAMEIGKSYTRREIAQMVGIDYSCASGRVVELIKSGDLVECGVCNRGWKGRIVGVVALSLARAA